MSSTRERPEPNAVTVLSREVEADREGEATSGNPRERETNPFLEILIARERGNGGGSRAILAIAQGHAATLNRIDLYKREYTAGGRTVNVIIRRARGRGNTRRARLRAAEE